MKIVWVNARPLLSTSGCKMGLEPFHLLPMHHIAKRYGHESVVVPALDPNMIKGLKPDVVGLSYVGHDVEDIARGRRFIESFPSERRPRVLLGGSDMRFHGKKYLEVLGDLFPPEAYDALTIVVGPGEGVIEALAPHDFSIIKKDNFNGLPIETMTMSNGRVILFGSKGIPLAEQDFTRPWHDLQRFANAAQLKLATGCAHSCGFCTNEPEKADYRTVPQAKADVREAIGLGAIRGEIAAANFLANPQKGTEILLAAGRCLPLFYSSRVDSLYRAITRWPSAWRKIRKWGHEIELGIESVLPLRLLRIGKHKRIDAAIHQNERLDRILGFFRRSNTKIEADLIMFDPGMWLGELVTEVEVLQSLQAKYSNFIIHAGSVVNRLAYKPGSPLVEERKMQQIDFWNYQRDPRCLLLALVMHKLTWDIYSNFFVNRYLEEAVSSRMLEYTHCSALALQKISPNQFALGPILAKTEDSGQSEVDVLEVLFSQMQRSDRVALDEMFENMRYHFFPEFFSRPQQGLMGSIRKLMGL